MVTVPADTPVTVPDVEPTVACPLLALHVPPDGDEVKLVDWLIHNAYEPVLLDGGPGSGSTDTALVAKQPVKDTVYVTFATPVVRPQTTPELDPTDAYNVDAGSLHVPPGVGSVRVNPHVPTQTCGLAGLIAAGDGFTVTTVVTEQIPPLVYVTLNKPVVLPVTVPEVAPIVAILGLGEPDQVLDAIITASLSVILVPGHTWRGPVIGAGVGTTVTTMPFTFVQPAPSVAVTEYVVVTDGVAVTVPQVVQLRPVDGVHEKEMGGVELLAVALKEALEPLHMAVSALTDKTSVEGITLV